MVTVQLDEKNQAVVVTCPQWHQIIGAAGTGQSALDIAQDIARKIRAKLPPRYLKTVGFSIL